MCSGGTILIGRVRDEARHVAVTAHRPCPTERSPTVDPSSGSAPYTVIAGQLTGLRSTQCLGPLWCGKRSVTIWGRPFTN